MIFLSLMNRGKYLLSKVAVCLIHTARLECTRKAINHLQKTVGVTPHIFLLIQGPQSPKTEEYLSSHRKNVSVINSPKNIGCWPGRQLLLKIIKKLGYDYVLIIDNDVYVPPNWFIEMEKTWLSAPDNIAAVGMILDQGSGKFYGGLDFGIKNNKLVYSPIHLPYDNDLVCSACAEGAIMVHRNNISLLQTDLIHPPYSGYDLLLNIWKKGYKFIICNGVVAKHYSIPTKDYVSTRYHKSASETYKKFCKKWNIKLGWSHELSIKFPIVFPRLWGYLKYSRHNIYKILKYFVLPVMFAILFRYTAPFYPLLEDTWYLFGGRIPIPSFLEFGPLHTTTHIPTVLLFLYGTLTIASMYLMIGHIPLLIIPFMSLGLTVFATDYWEYPYFLLQWLPIYFQQVHTGIRGPLSFLWSSSFLHLYGGLAMVLLFKIKWSKKIISLFLLTPWIMWLINQLYPLPAITIKVYSPIFGPLNPFSLVGSIIPWLLNRIVCSIVLLYLLRHVRWQGVWKVYRMFITKIKFI